MFTIHVSKTISKHEAKQESDNSPSTIADSIQQQDSSQEQDAFLLSINVKPMPRIKLEPNREQIYDESLYVIDQHGFLMTKKDYILLYGTDPWSDSTDSTDSIPQTDH